MVKQFEDSEDKPAKQEAKIKEMPSQFVDMVELEDGTIVSSLELLVRVYNKLLKIEKAI